MTCAQGLLRLLGGGGRSWSATGLLKIVDDEVSTVATKLEFLKMLITEDFINEILNQTNLYAQQKNERLKK